MWYCWYIYIFFFCSASCDIDIRKHDYIVTFRVVFRGGRPTQSMSIEIVFFLYIFLVVVALSQGSSLLFLKKICDNLAIFGRSLKNTHNHTQTLQAYFRQFVKT